jgi:multicomponent K+:H+ antiporter subunit A
MSHEGALLLTIAALPFLGALLPGLMIRAGRNVRDLDGRADARGVDDADDPGAGVLRGEVVQAEIEWLPQLGLSAAFFLDGLGLLFAG